MPLIRSYLCTLILLFFSFSHTFCATNTQQESIKLSKKGLLAKITWKKTTLGSGIAILLYLVIQQKNVTRYAQNLFNSKKQPSSNKQPEVYIDQQKAIESQKKKKDQYNKEAREMWNNLLMYTQGYKINQTSFRDFLQRSTCDRIEFVENLKELKVYHEQRLIENMDDIEKIKILGLINYFAIQSDEFCLKIATVDTQAFDGDFDFYAHKNKWYSPTNDDIFRYIPNLIFVNDQGNVCFGVNKHNSFEINDIESVLNLLVGSLVDNENGSEESKDSINGLMCAIYISLLNPNTVDHVASLYVPKLKKLLEDGYDLSNEEKEKWFVHIFCQLPPNEGTFKAILGVLNCFYPTEFLLSEQCLMTNGLDSTLGHISYKMWGTFNNHHVPKPKPQDQKREIKILYHVLPIFDRAHSSNTQTIFDFLFTPENLSKKWLRNLLEKEGLVHADVIWRGLQSKTEEERSKILNAIGSALKDTLLRFEDKEGEISFSSNIPILIQTSFDYDNRVQQMRALFFVSPDRFSQLFYTLLKNKDNFSHYMSNLFELEDLFNPEKNLFLDFVRHRFVDQDKEDQNPIGHVFNHLVNPIFLRDTTPGMVISNQYYFTQKNLDPNKSFIRGYTATRTNTLLLFTWYNLYTAIDLYKNSNNQYPERFNNKNYLAETFKTFLRPYRLDTSSIGQLGDKGKVCDGDDGIINVAKAYHLFEHVIEQSLYKVSNKENFKNANQEWIKENEMCRYIANEIYSFDI